MLGVDRKSRWCISLAGMLVLACACPSSLMGGKTDQQPKETEAWQDQVVEIQQLTPGQPIPWHLVDPEAPVVEDLFDPNKLLEPLSHLGLRPGYTLDFVYRDDGIGARPVIYAHRIDEPPFANYQAWWEANQACVASNLPEECEYLAYVEMDGTDAGYFEWVLLRMMGDQFYLYWHAGYHDAEIIASTARLQTLVETLGQGSFEEPLSTAQKRAALKIDPAPEVKIGRDSAAVRVVWFTLWGGFYETTYTITASSPHRVVEQQTVHLVEYDCGIQF